MWRICAQHKSFSPIALFMRRVVSHYWRSRSHTAPQLALQSKLIFIYWMFFLIVYVSDILFFAICLCENSKFWMIHFHVNHHLGCLKRIFRQFVLQSFTFDHPPFIFNRSFYFHELFEIFKIPYFPVQFINKNASRTTTFV